MNDYHELLKIIRKSSYYNKPTGAEVSGMDIIFTEALLMDAGSLTFKAIKSGEIVAILGGLVSVAYCSLQFLAGQPETLNGKSNEISNDYLMINIARHLSQKIADCTSGNPKDYLKLFYYCSHLGTFFINADFKRALSIYHDFREANSISFEVNSTTNLPDFTDCLYE